MTDLTLSRMGYLATIVESILISMEFLKKRLTVKKLKIELRRAIWENKKKCVRNLQSSLVRVESETMEISWTEALNQGCLFKSLSCLTEN